MNTTTTTTTETIAARRAVLTLVGSTDPAVRRRAVGVLLSQEATQAAARACAAGAHRHQVAAERRRRTESALGAAPRAVLVLVERAYATWQARLSLAAHQGEDALAIRSTGTVPSRAVRRELRRLYRVAGFRSASHAHHYHLAYGDPWAWSRSGKVDSAAAGMSKAYCRKQYTVSSSEHQISSDASLFSTPRAVRAGPGWIQLSPEVRVRQGRGTSLVVDRTT